MVMTSSLTLGGLFGHGGYDEYVEEANGLG